MTDHTAAPGTAAPWPFTLPEPRTENPDPGDGEAACFARVFAGADGRRVLTRLRAMTLDRALGADASDAALRHLEGQRALVALILALVRRGGGAP